MTRNINIKGGAKIIPKKGETIEELTGFLPVQKMLNSENAELDLLTYNSLKGFMFTLKVDSEESRYNTLGDSYLFDTPITNFILKIVVITPLNNIILPKFEGIIKASESKESFFEEAKLQMKIWKNSILNGHTAICPSVANLSIFSETIFLNNPTIFIDSLLDIPGIKKDKKIGAINCLTYLKDFLLDNETIAPTIGVMLMPNIENSFPFYSFIENIENPNVNRDFIISYLSAQVVRLFLICKTIHFDLHEYNSLVKNDNELIIIDFGRASDLTSEKNDEYLNINEKTDILLFIKSKFRELLVKIYRDNSFDNEQNKILFMKSILQYIYNLDKQKNGLMFGNGTIQMNGWFKRINDTHLSTGFDILKPFFTVNKDFSKNSRRYIEILERNGEIFTFNDIEDVNISYSKKYLDSFKGKLKKIGKNLLYCSAVAGTCYVVGKNLGLFGGRTKNKKKRNRKTRSRKY